MKKWGTDKYHKNYATDVVTTDAKLIKFEIKPMLHKKKSLTTSTLPQGRRVQWYYKGNTPRGMAKGNAHITRGRVYKYAKGAHFTITSRVRTRKISQATCILYRGKPLVSRKGHVPAATSLTVYIRIPHYTAAINEKPAGAFRHESHLSPSLSYSPVSFPSFIAQAVSRSNDRVIFRIYSI